MRRHHTGIKLKIRDVAIGILGIIIILMGIFFPKTWSNIASSAARPIMRGATIRANHKADSISGKVMPVVNDMIKNISRPIK